MCDGFIYTYKYVPCIWLVAKEIRKKCIGSPGTGIIGGCKSPQRGCKPNLATVKEYQMHLTTEPSLQPQ